MNRLSRLLAVLLLAAGVAGGANAQDYPTKSIRIIVPFPPGGPTDLAARIIADTMSKSFGHSAVVENVPGAGGVLGSERVAKSAPDGYTILMGSSGGLSVAPSLYSNMSWHPAKDLQTVSLVLKVPGYLAIHPRVPANNVKELIAYLKKNPRLSYASAGNGTSLHTSMELFKTMAGVFVLHVPYRGSAPAAAALLGGEVDMSMDMGPVIIPHVKSGRLKVLAVTTEQRARALPDVPTLSEAGLPGFSGYAWFGMMAPTGVPRDIVMKLHGQVVKAMEPADVRKRMEDLGSEVVASTPEEFAAFQKSEIEKWGKVIKAAGIKVD
ncbi:MAG: tripartite tricarboxylate transporter substrate binding protein [Betaproteobacteria bacterium]|nr:tripartite tricarboxylate transporter substrate binding protein [Betaproteobacteria bacterium]